LTVFDPLAIPLALLKAVGKEDIARQQLTTLEPLEQPTPTDLAAGLTSLAVGESTALVGHQMYSRAVVVKI
jgi:hypothetical protein